MGPVATEESGPYPDGIPRPRIRVRFLGWGCVLATPLQRCGVLGEGQGVLGGVTGRVWR